MSIRVLNKFEFQLVLRANSFRSLLFRASYFLLVLLLLIFLEDDLHTCVGLLIFEPCKSLFFSFYFVCKICLLFFVR